MTPPALEVRDLTVRYDRELVLQNITFQLAPGRVTGILGPNGAGKSTLLKAILGLLKADTGEVRAFGGPLRDARQRVVYVPQRSAVDWDFPITVAEVVLMGRYGRLGLFGRPSKEDRRIAAEALEQLGITDLAARQISELSGGQQQRTFLARALAQQGDLILMDEPFVGVDARTEHAIVALLHQLRDDGRTSLIVNHDLQTARAYFDDLLLLNRTLIAHGTTPDVFTPERLAACYGGRLAVLATDDGQTALLTP